jgi:hypothetical protein
MNTLLQQRLEWLFSWEAFWVSSSFGFFSSLCVFFLCAYFIILCIFRTSAFTFIVMILTSESSLMVSGIQSNWAPTQTSRKRFDLHYWRGERVLRIWELSVVRSFLFSIPLCLMLSPHLFFIPFHFSAQLHWPRFLALHDFFHLEAQTELCGLSRSRIILPTLVTKK